jgi:hypothetical protein
MAKKTQTAVVPYNPNAGALAGPVKDRFAKHLSRESAAKVGSTLWPFLGTRGVTFRNGETKLGPEIDGIILGTAVVNQYYEGDYDPDNAAGPVCYAIADLEGAADPQAVIDSLAPPADLPTRVAESCRVCPMNAWGSGKGRGKACKNGRRLTILGYSPTTDLEKTAGARVNVPVMSVRKLADYAKRLAEIGRPLIATVTRFSLTPGDKGGFNMDFEPVGAVNDLRTLDVLEQRAKEGRESLLAPPSTEPSAPKKEAKGAAPRRMVKRK